MVIWITGLSGSGKTTIAREVYKNIKSEYSNTVILDGDIIRKALNNNYGYSLSERHKGALQVSGLCKMLDAEGLIVVCATMSLFHDIQESNRKNIENYIEIYLEVDLEILKKRDRKNLYSEAINGNNKNVVGVDLSYEKPKVPELMLKNETMEQLADNINSILFLTKKTLLKKDIHG
jgi:adenylyl-sulfate kinase